MLTDTRHADRHSVLLSRLCIDIRGGGGDASAVLGTARSGERDPLWEYFQHETVHVHD